MSARRRVLPADSRQQSQRLTAATSSLPGNSAISRGSQLVRNVDTGTSGCGRLGRAGPCHAISSEESCVMTWGNQWRQAWICNFYIPSIDRQQTCLTLIAACETRPLPARSIVIAKSSLRVCSLPRPVPALPGRPVLHQMSARQSPPPIVSPLARNGCHVAPVALVCRWSGPARRLGWLLAHDRDPSHHGLPSESREA